MSRRMLAVWCGLLVLGLAVRAQAPVDETYTKQIHEYTTEPFFLTDWVDTIPDSPTVPSPLDVLGYIPGTPGKLTDVASVHRYFRELAKASPRVEVLTLGHSEEGREMILAVVADAATLARIDHYREITARLADPRKLTQDAAEALIREGKPIYWLLGGLHSPETGSPEMLMELAYRLAVSDDPRIETIRKNVIVLITPIQEVDGRDRIVDIMRYRAKYPDRPAPSLVYWGHYVAHDNNRDHIGLALKLTRNILRGFLTWHPQVMHDLHESVPFLYIMGGTGPFNAWLDPTVVDEWRKMAWIEVEELTRQGVPGVWTHGFWDGWAPNYVLSIAMARNAVGRFYETFGNSVPDTMERTIRRQTRKEWYRLNPPLSRVRWSLRNNINLQQSGVLIGLYNVARHREDVLRNFYTRSVRAVKKPDLEGPAAWVLPASEKRKDLQARLVQLLLDHGVEIHRAEQDFQIGKTKYLKGSFIIRMDQPYSRLADMLLDRQYYNPRDPRPYDDTGWTLGEMFNVKTVRITDKKVLDVKMTPVSAPVRVPGRVDGRGNVWLMEATGEPAQLLLPFRFRDLEIYAADAEFKQGKTTWPRGTWILVPTAAQREALAAYLAEHGLHARRVKDLPEVDRHPVRAPRIAIVHSWAGTQDEGWYRYAFDVLGIPYDYVSVQVIGRTPDLKARWDVLLFAPGIGSPQDLVQGLTGNAPIPWKKTDLTPNLGRIDSTDDMRPGMGLEGVMHIKKFLEDGGTLIAVESSVRFPVSYGLVRWVQVREPRQLRVSGTLVRGERFDRYSPIAYGYDKELTLYYDGEVLLDIGIGFGRFARFFGGDRAGRPSGRGGPKDRDVIVGRPPEKPVPPPKPKPWEEGFFIPDPFFRMFFQNRIPPIEQRPRVIVRFAEKANELLVSGLLDHGQELAGKPALVDVPVGQGHVVLFAFNPVWRNQTWGQYGLVLNTLVHHRVLGLGWPPPEAKKPETQAREKK